MKEEHYVKNERYDNLIVTAHQVLGRELILLAPEPATRTEHDRRPFWPHLATPSPQPEALSLHSVPLLHHSRPDPLRGLRAGPRLDSANIFLASRLSTQQPQ